MKFQLILILTFLSQGIFSQVNYEESLNAAFKKAKAEKKFVFVKFYGESCSHCQELQRILDNDSVYPFVNKTFVNFKINSEDLKVEDVEFTTKYHFNIESIPMLLFFDSLGNFIHFSQPKREVSTVLSGMTKALDPFERFINLEKRYKNGDRTPLTLKLYSKTARLLSQDSMVDVIANDLFLSLSPADLVSRNSLVITSGYVKNINNGIYKAWMENYKAIDTIAPDFKLKDKKEVFERILTESINKYKTSWNLEEIQTAKRYVKITGLNQNQNIFTWQEEIALHLKNKDEANALKVGMEMLEAEKNNIEFSTYVCQYLIEDLTIKEAYTSIETYLLKNIKETTELEKNAKFRCVLVYLYRKFDMQKELKKTEAETRQFLKDNKLDVQQLDDILKK